MMNYSEVSFITEFRGECAYKHDTHLDYVKSGDWEKDYFVNWLESWGEDEFPSIEAIGDCCKTVSYYMGHWLSAVDAGLIDPEAKI